MKGSQAFRNALIEAEKKAKPRQRTKSIDLSQWTDEQLKEVLIRFAIDFYSQNPHLVPELIANIPEKQRLQIIDRVVIQENWHHNRHASAGHSPPAPGQPTKPSSRGKQKCPASIVEPSGNRGLRELTTPDGEATSLQGREM